MIEDIYRRPREWDSGGKGVSCSDEVSTAQLMLQQQRQLQQQSQLEMGPNGVPMPPQPQLSVADRLMQLDQLAAQGLISHEENQQRRAQVLSEI